MRSPEEEAFLAHRARVSAARLVKAIKEDLGKPVPQEVLNVIAEDDPDLAAREAEAVRVALEKGYLTQR